MRDEPNVDIRSPSTGTRIPQKALSRLDSWKVAMEVGIL